MSKIIKTQISPKIKNIEIWRIRYFKYTDFEFNIKNDFYEIFTSCQTKLTPRLKLLRNSCLIFQIFIYFVSLKTYQKLWSASLNSNLNYKM